MMFRPTRMKKHGKSTEESTMNRLKQATVALLTLTTLVINPSAAIADEDTVALGEKLYSQNCSICHQADAIGIPGFAPSLSNPEFLSVSSDKFLLATIRAGRPGTGMPPFAHLGRDQGRAILAYLRSFAKIPNRSAEIDAQPVAQGDSQHGNQLYDQICSTCHGPDGDGYLAGGTGTAIGKFGTLSKVSDGFLRTTIKEGRTNTRMLGFSGPAAMADLTDQEIDDVIVYLRTIAE